MKKIPFLFLASLFHFVASAQSRATLDSVLVEYKECLETTKNRVTCTKELFWYYQDVQFNFSRKASAHLDSLGRDQKAKECGEWVGVKNLFVAMEFRKFKDKYPKEKMVDPISKAAENDAYVSFKKICDFIMVRINSLLETIEANEKK